MLRVTNLPGFGAQSRAQLPLSPEPTSYSLQPLRRELQCEICHKSQSSSSSITFPPSLLTPGLPHLCASPHLSSRPCCSSSGSDLSQHATRAHNFFSSLMGAAARRVQSRHPGAGRVGRRWQRASSLSPRRGGTCPVLLEAGWGISLPPSAHPELPGLFRTWEHFPDASVCLKVKKMSGKAHVMGA